MFESARISDSNFRKLLLGLAGELFTAEGYLKTVSNEYDINTTSLLIDEWEGALGIPDSCFSGGGTLEERRRDILVKLASLGVQTEDDLINLAALFGVTITVSPGIDFAIFPLTFPWLFFSSETEARFTIIVDFSVQEANKFTLTFPFIFGTGEVGILECLFTKLKPANCDIIFRQV
ncbi:DUF2313 domain-containing protein [bacterium]|nr:DUF2313 domain-containing protein [bacterium]